MFLAKIVLLLLASVNAFKPSPVLPNTKLEGKATCLVSRTVGTVENEFKVFKDQIDDLDSVVKYAKEGYIWQQSNFLDVRGLEDKIELLEVLEKGDDPGFMIYGFLSKRLSLINSDGSYQAHIESSARIRGMYCNPLTQRVFTFVQPVISYDLSLRNKQIFSDATVPKSRTTGSMEGDPCIEELYMTFFSLDEIWKVGMNGSGLTKIVSKADCNGPLGSRIDTRKGMLYWADFDGKAIKSVNVHGPNNVTTIHRTSPERPRGLDVDLKEGKIYWCANNGNLFTFDMTNGINTKLDNNPPGQCDTLRLWNGHIYMTHARDSGIRKLSTNGTLIKMIYNGRLREWSNKYFNLL